MAWKIAASILLAVVSSPLGAREGAAKATADGKQRGVSWVGGRRPVVAADFDRLVANGVEWIAQNPFGWQRGIDTPEIVLAGDKVWWGESDEGIAVTTRLARERGIRTMLRPHLWLTDAGNGQWLGDVAMRSEEDWQRWFRSYERFILHYARLAEDQGIELLGVGAELSTAATTRPADWRRVIARVREVYHGRLTYAANWHGEFEEIVFWDALDLIGIQAYFPLGDSSDPQLETLEAAWRTHRATIERVQRRFGKPVLFTEIGYRAAPDATVRPWEWPERKGAPATEEGSRVQARGYEAFFRTFWRQDWFAGAYVWKWFPGLELRGGESSAGFSPQNRPAEQVMARWYLDR